MDYKARIKEIKIQYQTYQIDINEAKRLAAPIITAINNDAQQIAKKYHIKHKPFTFNQLILNQ